MNLADHLLKCKCGGLWFEKVVNVTLTLNTKEEERAEISYKCKKCGKEILHRTVKE